MERKKKVGITDTTLRDAHQSLMATRMRTEDMLPILPEIDKVGYHSLEVWGGATFDTCLRYLNEDPWERLVKIREYAKNSRLQMLLRGQNLVAYRHYADDVVDAFAKAAVKNGIDIVRIFDALNDIRNMEKAMQAVKAAGGHVQATISYTISPVHNIDYFVDLAVEMEKKGADSLCIKDMAGLITPYHAYELVEKLKSNIKIPVQLHSHFTSGMAAMSYLKAIEAGCDVVDTATSSISQGSSQPAVDTIVAALRGTPYDTELDLELIAHIDDYFKKIRGNYEVPLQIGVDTAVLNYQIPGGMLSNLASQLAAQNASHLMDKVYEEVPRVRQELGYPPLVTPSSQIVGTQAVMNIITGERYKVTLTEVKNYLKGLYGKPPGEVDPDLLKKVLKDEEPFQGRPADLLEPQMDKAREELGAYLEKEEDVLTYILFPQQAMAFFKQRKKGAISKKLAAGMSRPEARQELKLENLYAVDETLFLSEDEKHFVYPCA
ncbi:MAG: pyruvate carboxylase subunit B [Firmicutes bacterium]|nr:pyruvate carboxylase subunit B [Bacillota bacterium]